MNKKMNNLLKFSEFSIHGEVNESSLNHMRDFDNFESLEEGIVNDLLKKVGFGTLTKEETIEKFKKVDLDKLKDDIRRSSNPKAHMRNWKSLEGKDELSFAQFILFLYKKRADLRTGTPLYYKIDQFGTSDTSLKTHQNGLT